MIRPRSSGAALVAVPLLLLAACSGADSAPEPAPVTSTPAVESATPSATESAIPTPTPTPEPRKKSQLRKALLSEDDLPSGFSTRKATSAAESGITVTGSGTSCAELAELLQADKLDGSLVTASRSFAGRSGAGVDQSLDALPSAAEAAALVSRFRTAASTCPALRLKLRGSGSSTLKVSVLEAPQLGDTSVTTRFTTVGGDVAGLSLTQVVASSEDIVLGLLVADLTKSQVEQVAGDAMTRVTERLT